MTNDAVVAIYLSYSNLPTIISVETWPCSGSFLGSQSTNAGPRLRNVGQFCPGYQLSSVYCCYQSLVQYWFLDLTNLCQYCTNVGPYLILP